MGGGKKNENENENGRKREFATDPRSKRAREKNTPFGHAPHSDGALLVLAECLSGAVRAEGAEPLNLLSAVSE